MPKVPKLRFIKNELARFVFAGILNTLLTLAVFIGAIFLGVPYIVANVISWVIGILFSYSLNTIFVFDKIHSIQRLLWFFSTYVVSFLVSTLMLIVFIESYQMNPISAQFIALPLIVLFNYMLSKYLIFRH
jgi:putative flippase GtrA